MKNQFVAIILIVLAVCLAGCLHLPEHTADPSQMTEDTSSANIPETTEAEIPETTEAEVTETTAPPETEPEHSELYIEGLDVEDVIRYFNEVCLDAEFSENGNASLVQKWSTPIYYKVYGTATEKDIEVFNEFVKWLNTIEGFPGISEAKNAEPINLRFYFCTNDELLNHLGDNFYGSDGGVTFWYMDNQIYDAIICCRTDLNQVVRNSVILEEIYNGLGPVQDTVLREDSIIYSYYSEPQSLTEVDELILKLLYHPDIVCGMDATDCEAVIRQLYY